MPSYLNNKPSQDMNNIYRYIVELFVLKLTLATKASSVVLNFRHDDHQGRPGAVNLGQFICVDSNQLLIVYTYSRYRADTHVK